MMGPLSLKRNVLLGELPQEVPSRLRGLEYGNTGGTHATIAKRMRIKVKKIRPEARLPLYAHNALEDAGMDLFAAADVELPAGETRLVPTGLTIELPSGYEAQIRPRSGLAFKHSLTIPNAPGTIDPGFRGEVQIILHNLGRQAYHVRTGDRIAQMVIARYEAVEWEEEELSETARGEGGFGSSGR